MTNRYINDIDDASWYQSIARTWAAERKSKTRTGMNEQNNGKWL